MSDGPRQQPVILVVDDEAEHRRLIALMIARTPFAGATVIPAANGQEGLVLAQRTRPALVLLDLYMPVVDGREFLRAYRALPVPHAPVVLFSVAYDRTDPWVQAQTAD